MPAAKSKPPKSSWSKHLARPLRVRDGPTLRTLSDARAYILDLPPGTQKRNTWQHAARLAIEAAEGGDIDPATKQIESDLFMEWRLKL